MQEKGNYHPINKMIYFYEMPFQVRWIYRDPWFFRSSRERQKMERQKWNMEKEQTMRTLLRYKKRKKSYVE